MEVFNREQDDRHKRAACAVWELKLAVVKHFLLTAIELNANAGSVLLIAGNGNNE